MPRANRIIQPGGLYHLTHRCHDRQFLFRFAVTREAYRKRLRAALKRHPVGLLNYCITSNHTHLLAEADTPTSISGMMQQLEGEFAEWYNRRKRRSGAFWEDRYHCTLVDDGEYALNCMRYIDLNMVRAGVVRHPSEWRWCGYHELVGMRRRYRLLDLDRVLDRMGGVPREEFVQLYRSAIVEGIEAGRLAREPIWTESIAVGSSPFVKRVAGSLKYRIRLQEEEVAAGVWTVREASIPYRTFSGDENPR